MGMDSPLGVPSPSIARASSGGGTPVLTDARGSEENGGSDFPGLWGEPLKRNGGPFSRDPVQRGPAGAWVLSEGSEEEWSQCKKGLSTLNPSHLSGWAGLGCISTKGGSNLALPPLT